MPIVSGISFGMTIPYNRVSRRTRNYNQMYKSTPPRTRAAQVMSVMDFAERGVYKYNKSNRVLNQYKLYNRKVDTPTRGTLINLEF